MLKFQAYFRSDVWRKHPLKMPRAGGLSLIAAHPWVGQELVSFFLFGSNVSTSAINRRSEGECRPCG